jgi:hypothetical protein
MPDWRYVDRQRLLERFALGLVWPPTMLSLVFDIVIGMLFLKHGLAANDGSAHPHPNYRARWTQLYFGKRSRPGTR